MSHFDLTRWVDFVRGVVPTDERAPMETHLSACTDCSTLVDLLARVVRVSAADRNFEPAAELVSAAEAVYPRADSVGWPDWAGLKRLATQITYSGPHDPLPAGARSLRMEARQVTVRSERYWLDLRFEADTLVGQVAQHPGPSLENLPVCVLAGKKVVAQALSNEFGEFYLPYRTRRNLRLVVALPAEKECLEVNLNPLLRTESGSN